MECARHQFRLKATKPSFSFLGSIYIFLKSKSWRFNITSSTEQATATTQNAKDFGLVQSCWIIYDFHCNWCVLYFLHIQPIKHSHFICLHRPKLVSSPVCACVLMCRLCFAWGSAMSGPASRREPPQPNNEELYGGDRMGSRYAVELGPYHLINCFVTHIHTHLLHRHIYSALTEPQTDVTFKQQSPGEKYNVCTHTAHPRTADRTNKAEREN